MPYARAYTAGDVGITNANNGDANMDGNPAGTAEGYPTSMQVRRALIENDVQLIVGYVDCGAVGNCNNAVITNRYQSEAAITGLNDNFNYWSLGLLYKSTVPKYLDVGFNFGGLVSMIYI